MAEMFDVLLVESNPQGLRNLAGHLADDNLSVTTALSVRETYSQVIRKDFDLIVLSIHFPNMEGFSIASKIRNRERSGKTPILLLTSGDEEEPLVTRGYPLGMVDHLTMPVSPSLLKAKVKMWVELSRRFRKQGAPARQAEAGNAASHTEGSSLHSEESRFRQAVEGAQDSAILWLNAQGLIVNSNSAAKRMLGYAEQELQGMSASRLFIPEDRDAGIPEEERRLAVEHGQGVDERWHQRKDGSRFWAVGLVTPLWKGPGEVEGYIKILRDRTDQKLAFDLARDTEERYKQLLDSTAEGIFGIDLNGHCTFANASCLQLLGYPDEPAMLGQSIHHIIPHGGPDGAPCRDQECPIISAIRNGEESHGEDSFQRSNGSRIPVEFRTHSVRFEGNVIGAVVTFLDISERKRTEALLQAAESRNRQAQRIESIGRLAGGVAHELNNDLTAIIGFGELLRDHLDEGSPILPGIDEILRSGKRAADLIRRLLAFAGKQVLISKPIRLDVYFQESFPHFQRVAGEKVRLSLDLDPDLPQVYADPDQLEQSLISILANAVEAMSDGGDLVITGRTLVLANPLEAERISVRPGTYACLSISDTGHGMPQELQEKLFEPFFSTKTMGKSVVGMGLPSAYGFIRQSGGAIHVESEPGRGAAFKIYLPTVPISKNH
jgi:PAS domain S-box-containing protein